MREILFRGFNEMVSEWFYGMPVYCYGDSLEISKAITTLDGDIRVVDPETIGQYTGLKDKNGVRIFEGDILHAEADDEEIEFSVEWIEYWSGFGYRGKTPKDIELPEDWPGVFVSGSIYKKD